MNVTSYSARISKLLRMIESVLSALDYWFLMRVDIKRKQ